MERAIATVVTAAAFLFLAWSCWKLRGQSHEVQRYLWSATFTWTLLINIYAPVYDTILLVPAAALLARSLVEQSKKQEQAGLQVWLIVLWLAPWVTQSWADYLRLQILTLVLAGFGYWALTLARSSSVLSVTVPQEHAVLDAA